MGDNVRQSVFPRGGGGGGGERRFTALVGTTQHLSGKAKPEDSVQVLHRGNSTVYRDM